MSDAILFGVFEFAGESYQGIHKPLISKSLFYKCQEAVMRKSKTHFNHKEEFHFLGLAKCKECNSAITAEKHFKYYPKTRGKVRYDYYRCGKKHGFCSQKYMPAPEFEKQLREIVLHYSLHPENAKKFINWLHADEIKEQTMFETKMEKLKIILTTVERKLDRLLTGYLDQVIDASEYQTMKKKLLDEKTSLEEEIKRLKDGSIHWVELAREYIDGALEGYKVARSKNNPDDLAVIGKKVGSNYFVFGRRLTAVPSPSHKLLAAPTPAASQPLPLHTLRRG